MIKSTSIMMIVLVLVGCAAVERSRELPVGLDQAMMDQGTLASLAPSDFAIGTFELVGQQLRRSSPNNVVGSDEHGSFHDLKTTDPVPTLVSDAISLGLVENGHRISDGAPILLEGDITTFWLFMHTCRIGSSIAVTVRAIDEKTRGLIYENDYQVRHVSLFDCSSNAKYLKRKFSLVRYNHKQRTEAINGGLRRLVVLFTRDQGLVDALQRRSQ